MIGGGFTDLWAAMQAKERKPNADIVLVEQTFDALSQPITKDSPNRRSPDRCRNVRWESAA